MALDRVKSISVISAPTAVKALSRLLHLHQKIISPLQFKYINRELTYETFLSIRTSNDRRIAESSLYPVARPAARAYDC